MFAVIFAGGPGGKPPGDGSGDGSGDGELPAPGSVLALARFYPTILHWLGMLRVPPQDRDDVAQEVLLAAWRSWSTYVSRPGVSEAAGRRRWLFRVTWHRAVQHGWRRRCRRRRETSLGEILESELDARREGAEPSTEELFLRREELHLLAWELDLEKLRTATTPERWAIFAAHVIEGLTIAALAAAVGLPSTTVWHRVREAKADMRAAILAERARRAARRRPTAEVRQPEKEKEKK